MKNPLPTLETHRVGEESDADQHAYLYLPVMRMGQAVASLGRQVDVFSGLHSLDAARGSVREVVFDDLRLRWLVYQQESYSSPGAEFADAQYYYEGPGGLLGSGLQDVFAAVDEPTETPDAIRLLFEDLAARWREETQLESSLARIFNSEAYLHIIGLGPAVVPYLIEAVPAEPERWLGALRAITRENPVPEGATRDDAVAAWRGWYDQQLAGG